MSTLSRPTLVPIAAAAAALLVWGPPWAGSVAAQSPDKACSRGYFSVDTIRYDSASGTVVSASNKGRKSAQNDAKSNRAWLPGELCQNTDTATSRYSISR